MQEIRLGNVTLTLSIESNGVRVKSENENIILADQSLDNTSEIIKHNFDIVSSHYMSFVNKTKGEVDLSDVYIVSVTIVLHYLYQYNSWRAINKRQQNQDLEFNVKDFNNPSTYDIIFHYYRTKYSINWKEKCAILLDIDLEELSSYYESRKDYYNK